MAIELSVYVGGDDFRLFSNIVNQGIDPYLEAFTESEFYQSGHRFHFNFTFNEAPILLRRLSELADSGDEEASRWLDDILNVYYGVEVTV